VARACTSKEAEWAIGSVLRLFQTQPPITGGTSVPPRWTFRTIAGSHWRLIGVDPMYAGELSRRLTGMRAHIAYGLPDANEPRPDVVVVLSDEPVKSRILDSCGAWTVLVSLWAASLDASAIRQAVTRGLLQDVVVFPA
jgi:hypothetical protein